MCTDLLKSFAAFVITAGLVINIPGAAMANETQELKSQVAALQTKVAQLEQQLAEQPSKVSQPKYPHPRSVMLDDWDPFSEMRLLDNQMRRMMQDNMVDFNPREDIKQTPEAYIISMDIPGMAKDNINVEVKQGMLIVSGERKGETKEDKDKFHRQERFFGNFYRSIALPQDAKAEAIDAQYENGVLTVKIGRNIGEPKENTSQKISVK